MPPLAIAAVLLAALTHATWNLWAKRAAGSRHFVWLYSLVSLVIFTPLAAWLFWQEPPYLDVRVCWVLLATGVLHLGYSLALQAGYRTSDLSVVYPIARGSGPLLSFAAAVIVLGESITWRSGIGVALIVVGILLIAELLGQGRPISKIGFGYGLLTGVFIAAYTINDAWAVKSLAVAPLLVDYAGNVVRFAFLSPRAFRDRATVAQEMRLHFKPAVVVGLLGPFGYILVLHAMQIAPISHVAPMRELATLVGTLFGVRLLQERTSRSRIFGALCIVAGVVTLALGHGN